MIESMHCFITQLGAVVSSLVLLCCNGAQAMEKVHVSSPEPVVFLKLAAQSLEEHRRIHGAYPRKWPELEITYVNGPYRVTDPDIRPQANIEQIWQPKNSNYAYRLTTDPGGSEFQVDALDRAGNIAYYIKSGQATPLKADQSSIKEESRTAH
jgi:hypothetical protein